MRVPSGEIVQLNCAREVLMDLDRGLVEFGGTAGAPDWLVAGVWLRTADAAYLATATVKVLPDGFVARQLCIDTPQELQSRLETKLPDIAARLASRGHEADLPQPTGMTVPPHLNPWPCDSGSMRVLVRWADRAAATHRIACGLLFEGDERALLVGTDPSFLAMVLSEDEGLIERYRQQCEALSPAEYLANYAS